MDSESWRCTWIRIWHLSSVFRERESARSSFLRVLKAHQVAFASVEETLPSADLATHEDIFNGGVAPVTFDAYRCGPQQAPAEGSGTACGGAAATTESGGAAATALPQRPVEYTRKMKKQKVDDTKRAARRGAMWQLK
jgi:hypothetical protein